MTKLAHGPFRGLITLTLIISFSIFFTSCKDDDKVDCDAIEKKLGELSDDLEDAIADGDCGDVADIYDEIIDLVEKAEDCEFVEDILDENDVDDVDELIELYRIFSNDCTNLDCYASEDQLYALFDDYYYAYDNANCNLMETLSEEILHELIRAENCDYIQEVIDNNFTDFDELMNDVMDSFAYDADYWGC